ncbi:MAG: amidase family protein, partial [Bryobacteraceae bacterium]
ASYVAARREMDRLRRAIGEVFATVDLLVTPATPVPAVTVEGADTLDTRPVGGTSLSLRNTAPFNNFGIPAISIPCGFSASGMPIGMQISGSHWGEQRVLQLAYAYERETQWHTRRPAV